jgi:transposase
LKTGVPWADLPAGYGSPSTWWRRVDEWSEAGGWDRIRRTLLSTLDRDGAIEWAAAFLDGSFVPSKKGATSVGRTKIGKGSKAMLVARRQRFADRPLLRQAREPHEVTLASRTLATVAIKKQRRGRPRTRMRELTADKGFDSAAFRRELSGRGIETCIPTRKYARRRKRGAPPRFSVASYAERWRVERCFAWFDNCRTGRAIRT